MYATFHYLSFEVHWDEEPHCRLHQFCGLMSLQTSWLVVVEVVVVGLVVEAAVVVVEPSVELMVDPVVEPMVGSAVVVVVSQ